MKAHHIKDDSETSTLAGRQNASVVRTLFDLFKKILINKRKKASLINSSFPLMFY